MEIPPTTRVSQGLSGISLSRCQLDRWRMHRQTVRILTDRACQLANTNNMTAMYCTGHSSFNLEFLFHSVIITGARHDAKERNHRFPGSYPIPKETNRAPSPALQHNVFFLHSMRRIDEQHETRVRSDQITSSRRLTRCRGPPSQLVGTIILLLLPSLEHDLQIALPASASEDGRLVYARLCPILQ